MGCCRGKNNAEYVPLSRTITINGITFDLREDRTWVVSGEGAIWGAITGDISDQADLINMLTDLANDINTEASARSTGDTNTLNSAKAYSDSLLISAFRPGGSWDASQGSWPTQTEAGDPLDGSFIFNVSAPGNIAGIEFDTGDNFYNIIPNPGQTLANWSRFEYNTQQATESERGTARIAAQPDVSNPNTINDTDFISPNKFWAAAKTVLFGIAEFLTAVANASINGITATTGEIVNGDTLVLMLSKLQGQINDIPKNKLIMLDELGPNVTPLTKNGDPIGINISTDGVSFNKTIELAPGAGIVMYTTPSETRVLATLNDSFEWEFTEVPL